MVQETKKPSELSFSDHPDEGFHKYKAPECRCSAQAPKSGQSGALRIKL
jgi:hypothetical protein